MCRRYTNHGDHKKDEALKLALEALKNGKRVRNAEGGTKYQPDLEDKALTAIKQALAAPVQEPVAWKWHQAPVKTSWGNDMVVADLAIDKDNTVSVYVSATRPPRSRPCSPHPQHSGNGLG